MNEIVNDGLELVKGTVDKITYKNDSNGYTVAVVSVSGEKLTVVGYMPFLSEGESCEFSGEFTNHQTYGLQFSVKSFTRCTPATLSAILKYLSSGILKGIGPATAQRIVEKFGTDSLDVIENHPEDLSTLRGISLSKAQQISESFKEQFGIQNLHIMLSPYDISPEGCIKIYKKFGKNSVDVIKENPYIVCSSDIGFSFEKAENIAYGLGVEPDNIDRLCAGIIYIFHFNLSNGHTCLPKDKVVSAAVNMLESDESRIEEVITLLTERLELRTLNIDNKCFLALPEHFDAERYIASRLHMVSNNVKDIIPLDELEIDYVENIHGIKFEELQRVAIKTAFSEGFVVITGGPGTGKTTTLNGIIELFERRDLDIILAAPTGRAAKRMTELTGREAKTIHRLLEADITNDGKHTFGRTEKDPLTADVIIVDEASMLDSLLFQALLRALKLSCRIILVGDANQLPSVSAGNVLRDIIKSECFQTVFLSKVFRQAKQSKIITNAHAIINGEKSDFSNKESDFFFLKRYSENETVNTVLELCVDRLPAAYNFDFVKDIQVICPSRKMSCGTYNLNNLLQACLNPQSDKKVQLSYKGVYFRENDKVMHIKNNYDLQYTKDNGEEGFGIYNGDVGIIEKIDLKSGTLKVRFDDRVVVYLKEQLDELELAYAVTVHKSQGSEFECVVIPLFDVPSKLVYRNLLYTAVTRAKKLLIIVGDESLYKKMAQNDKKSLRYTCLDKFLKDAENEF